jgi:4a-hydroxytetrahydrobiopterin dehydratase
MSKLRDKKCVPCEGKTEPLSGDLLANLLLEVPTWHVAPDNKSISRETIFDDFVTAVVFITDVAHIAEEEGHHPDLNLHSYNKVTVTLSTHAIGGLSENDFIIAAKIDDLLEDTLKKD